MDIILMAILNAPPILRWIIIVPLAIIGIVLVDILFDGKFKITPFASLFEFVGTTFERFFKYASIGAFLTIGGLLALRLIAH